MTNRELIEAEIEKDLVQERRCQYRPHRHGRKKRRGEETWTEPDTVDTHARCGLEYAWTEALTPSVLAWNESTVVKIARTIEEEGRLYALPILADALEEAGCAERELLVHLRTKHAEPCRILDLLLRPGISWRDRPPFRPDRKH